MTGFDDFSQARSKECPMTRSLVFKLVLAFLVVSVTGAVLTAVFARWATFREFDRLVLEQAQNNFLVSATAYYTERTLVL
jgi:hypothetical protein